MYIPIHKRTGNRHQPISDRKKLHHESHPMTKGVYTYEKVEKAPADDTDSKPEASDGDQNTQE